METLTQQFNKIFGMRGFSSSPDSNISNTNDWKLELMTGQDTGIIHKVTDTGNSTVNK
jgi:hypothetical protein